MSLKTIGETILSSFRFNRDGESYEASLSSVVCENANGDDEWCYSVIVIDDEGNLIMKEIAHDFLQACDIYDRLSILVEKFIIK
ncbi:hypothetical protein [Citrobacter sp. Cf042]|uniref:hypothetical protein n=1 Tax=Citrobacter sp. Cf042 TaxID=2985045 RepID=UPI0025818835|nr:hypothetical protein [Citrobacter sp. Cf042]MDM3287221.1 hypothetical protein [Citrobacter sp. Cf042]MEB0359557.1 hypothetical protein [Citrobacter freundii]HEF0028350.1 hypothetical protein [Citrobacter freundii]